MATVVQHNIPGYQPALGVRPFLFLDIDGVQHGQYMKYGYEQTRVIHQSVPVADVHPLLRARTSSHAQRFRTRVRTSPRLREDLQALEVDVLSLTTWLEHDSDYTFYEQTPGGSLPRFQQLRFPGRDEDGMLPESWKYDELCRVLDDDPRPFIWADDDEVPQFADAIAREFPHLPYLLIGPDYDMGLTHDHLSLMTAFSRRLHGAAVPVH